MVKEKDNYEVQLIYNYSHSNIHQLEENVNTQPNIAHQVQEIDKPLMTLKQNLTEKRNKKLTNNKTHKQRSTNHISKKRTPSQHQRTSNNQQQPCYQHRFMIRSYRAPYQHSNHFKNIISTTIQSVLSQILPLFNCH